MRFIILVTLFSARAFAAAAPSPAPSPPDGVFTAALEALDACAARLDRELDVGYERIVARCPELPQRLVAAGVERWLPSSWQDPHNDLSAGSLAELRTALAREHALAPIGRAPSARALKASLLGKDGAALQHSSPWQRLVNWLRAFFSARSAPQEPGFLSRLISRIGLPETLIRITTYVAFGLTIALALLILSNELRAAGILRGRARKDEGRRSIPAGSGEHAWLDVEQASLSERPRLLLTLILECLARLAGVPPARSLTTGELTRTLRLPDATDTQRLMRLATVAERVRYAAAPVSAEDLGQALDGGRRVLEALAAPRQPAAAP